MTAPATEHQGLRRPDAFTQAQLDWVPWLEPKPKAELTEEDYAALTDRGRVASPYFRLLVRDPVVLGARTRADNDIFYNVDGGLPRTERELAAAAVSRSNGCVYCASVHARLAARLSDRHQDVQRLLDEGPGAAQDPRWTAVIGAAAALTATPPSFGPQHVAALREAGFDDQAVVDVVQSAAFFAWANRLMLSLGEPAAPAAG